MKRHISTNQQGFTLIELLIATTVFSVILLVAVSTLIQIGRLYYKGVITTKTQNIARTTIDDVSRTIQFSSGNLQRVEQGTQPKIQAICLGNTRYTYVEGAQVDGAAPEGTYISDDRKIRHALWQDKVGVDCSADIPQLQYANPYQAYSNKSISDREGRELLEDNMRLQNFSVEPQPTANDVFSINVNIVYYADKDLLNDFDNPTACKGSIVGGQWCAISNLTSVVYSRAK